MHTGDPMQSALFEPTNLPEIEPSSPLTSAMFESPLIAMVGLVLMGVLLLLALRSRAQIKAGLIAFLCSLLLAGGLWVSSTLVETDRESVSNIARQLVDATATGDRSRLESIMIPSITVTASFASAQGRDKVVDLAAKRVPPIVDSYTIPEIRADLPGPRVARTMIKIRAKSDSAPLGSSWWMVNWQRSSPDSSDWLATSIQPVWIQGISSP
ncbi:MAG: hypothetical protein AB8C13_00290 [Phycisphaerales bacterium]